MGLQSLDILDFRNIQHASLSFSPGLNLISGANAAGKTSLLEAIYCLGRVRSFRTPVAILPIRTGQAAFRLVGHVISGEGRQTAIGIERQADRLQVHLGGKPIRRLSDLAGSLPVQVLSAETPTILSGGPRHRRQTLDWALFHVEHEYRDTWQRYARALRQRNAALRDQRPGPQVSVWDSELSEAGALIHAFRRDYFESLESHLGSEVENLLPGLRLSLQYHPGWPARTALPALLSQSLEKDRHRGYTQYGPHRADFSLSINGQSVASHCSRGQQKAVTVGFMLAQLKCQQARSASVGAFLLDDLTSELDALHQSRVMTALRKLNTQIFVTAIDTDTVDGSAWSEAKLFHVEHGVIEEVV